MGAVWLVVRLISQLLYGHWSLIDWDERVIIRYHDEIK